MDKKKNPCKPLTHKGLTREAEGTRTLNLRIDSPALGTLKHTNDKDLEHSEKTLYTDLRQSDSEGQIITITLPKELAEIVSRWHNLPENIKKTIFTLVNVIK